MTLTEKVDEFLNIIQEAPWVEVDNQVIDLEFEKHHNRRELISTITNRLRKFEPQERVVVVKNLFNYFPIMMNKLGIKPSELWQG